MQIGQLDQSQIHFKTQSFEIYEYTEEIQNNWSW